MSDTEKDVSSTPPLAACEPPFLVFPCVGKAPTYGLPLQQVVEWEQAYPDTDVTGECRKALAWIIATPGRRKTAAGIPRFLVGWLNRAVDSRTAERRQAERRTPPTNYRPTLHDEYDHWREDCHRDHNGECGNFTAHEVRKMRTA